MLLVSAIFFSAQIICIPEAEARSTGVDDYFAFSDNGIEYYVYFVDYSPNTFFKVQLKGVKNGKKVDNLTYTFYIGDVIIYELMSSGPFGNERGYVNSDSKANTIFNIIQSTDFRKATILSDPNKVYEIANNLLRKSLKTNNTTYYSQAIPYYERYLEQRIKLKEYIVNTAPYTAKGKLVEEADVDISVGYNEIGICYAAIGNYNKAEECYYKVKSISPPKNFYGEWRYYYGLLCEKLKLYDEALYNYNVALKEVPERAGGKWQNLLSDIKESKHRLENLGVKPSSKSQYSLSKDNDTNKIIEEVNVKIKAKDYESAKKILNEALKKEPNAELYLQLAKVHMKNKKKDYKLMIDLVSKAIKLDPKNPEYYDYMANIYWRAMDTMNYNQAKKYYEFYKYKANELRSLGSK